MDFFTKCHIPSIGKELKINKLCFGDYFQLNSYIANSDLENINETFNLICEKSLKNSKNFTNLDKFIILMHLNCVYLEPILKLSAKDEDSNPITYEVFLKNVIKKSQNYKFENFTIPRYLYYSDANDILKETGKNIEEIKDHIEENKILMFEVPEIVKKVPKVYFNCFDNSLFHFLKLVYSTNMNVLYKKIKTLKKEYNFLLSEIYEMSPKEMDMFLGNK